MLQQEKKYRILSVFKHINDIMTIIKEYLKQEKFENIGQEAMLSLLVAAAHMRKKFQNICQSHGLTMSQFNILRILRGKSPQGYPRCEISARMVEPAPDMTRLINRLVRAGYARREKSKQDRRQSLTFITDKGLSKLKEIDPDVIAFNHELTDKIGEESAKTFIGLCAQLITKK